MRLDRHFPLHGFAVALAGALALLTFNPAWSQGANAVFEGQPAMAGAQGGLGAQAGMAQGGIGVQGNEAAQRQLNLRKPSGLDSMPALPATTPAAAPVSARSDVTLVPKRDDIAREQRSPVKKIRKAAKRTLDRSRTGVGAIDAIGTAPN